MRVFHQIVVLGVGAAITFSSVGQSASAQPPVKSPESSTESNQLPVEQNVTLGPKIAPEQASDARSAIALSASSQSQENSATGNKLQLGSNSENPQESPQILAVESPKPALNSLPQPIQIGRASCRERVLMPV